MLPKTKAKSKTGAVKGKVASTKASKAPTSKPSKTVDSPAKPAVQVSVPRAAGATAGKATR